MDQQYTVAATKLETIWGAQRIRSLQPLRSLQKANPLNPEKGSITNLPSVPVYLYSTNSPRPVLDIQVYRHLLYAYSYIIL